MPTTHTVLPPGNRRIFLRATGLGLGSLALGGLLRAGDQPTNPFRGVLDRPHFAPKAKRVIYLFMAGGPSQLDLFDYKPILNERNGQDLPESVVGKAS